MINPHWRNARQLAFYKHDREVELGSTEKQLQLRGQRGTWTCELRFQIPQHNYSSPISFISYAYCGLQSMEVRIQQENVNLLLCFWSASQMLLFLSEELLSISEMEMFLG